MKNFLTAPILVSLALFGCSPDKKKKSGRADASAEQLLKDHIQTFEPAGSQIDYPKEYCQNVGLLPLRTDVSESLAIMCKDRTPTPAFLQFREQAIAHDMGRYTFHLLEEKVDPDTESSEMKILVLFHVALNPFLIKSLPLYQYILTPFKTNGIELSTAYQVRKDDPLDSGLHLWSVDNVSTLKMEAAENVMLTSARKTQFNLYQVLSGSEEMGLIIEHLTESNPEDFMKYHMVMVAFNDGTGYNNGAGGTVVIGYIHLKLNNQGYPAIARKTALAVTEEATKNYIAGVTGAGK